MTNCPWCDQPVAEVKGKLVKGIPCNYNNDNEVCAEIAAYMVASTPLCAHHTTAKLTDMAPSTMYEVHKI